MHFEEMEGLSMFIFMFIYHVGYTVIFEYYDNNTDDNIMMLWQAFKPLLTSTVIDVK